MYAFKDPLHYMNVVILINIPLILISAYLALADEKKQITKIVF